jgi:hypothetical protein
VRTLESIECWPGDEILLVGDGVYSNDHRCRHILVNRGNDWGHSERNHAMKFVRTPYMAHIDDDDWYVPGSRAVIQDAIHKMEKPAPILFRMQFPCGIVLWQDKDVRCGNVGTPMMIMPNEQEKLGKFLPFVGGDWAFLSDSKWNKEDIVWREEVIALLDHDPGAPSSAYASGRA